MSRKKAQDRERELLEEKSNQEANIKSMLERMESLDRTGMLDVSQMDKSVLLDQMQNLQAILNPDNETITLVDIGAQDGKQPFKYKT